jgi:hypothetical protein
MRPGQTRVNNVRLSYPHLVPPKPPKPRVSLYPSRVPCDHSVVITLPQPNGYRLAIWFYRGVRKSKCWLVSADESRDSIIKRMRNHHPCDVGFVKEPDL